jgi:4-carboxymuconolactone decarboxylase
MTQAERTYREVMLAEPPAAASPYDQATRDFLFGEVWARPGLSRRDRRLVTLACVGGAGTTGPIANHVYAALASGDLTLEELLEFALHFAVYCGWPKASQVETTIRAQWARLAGERGEAPGPWPALANETLGPVDHEQRLRGGEQCFQQVNVWPPPPRDSAYFQAGILGFVFGHVWQRPGLGVRDRRLVTLPCVGLSDALGPIHSHVGSALRTGDVSLAEMHEIILHFSAYYGFAKGEVLSRAAADEWARIQAEATDPSRAPK